MQLSDRGGQVVSRPTPNPVIAPGWFNNDLTQTTAPTVGDPDWANAVTAELLAFLTQVGLVASKTSVAQVLQAVMRIAAGNLTAVSGTTATLTADNAGLVLVNASANNVAITMPASASANGQSLEYIFVRTDSSANTVSVAAAGSDTSLPTGGFPFALAAGSPLRLKGDGVSKWAVLSNASAVVSVAGLTGAVTLAQLVTAGVAPSASPALTGTPTAPTAAVGTNTTQVATAAFTQAALPTTWNNVTSSRAIGTVYTNSSGKPMTVSAWGVASGVANLSGSVNGSQVATDSAVQNSGNSLGVSFQVPAGATYEVNWNNSSVSLSGWWELT